ncbi:MAG: DNA primase [Gammaproteobacteria bacterium]|nr:DNA primase [Gammaproteobacteria bacterium]
MGGRIPASFIDELVNRVDVVDLISSRVPLKKAGKDFQACCPFHDEKTPSFTVSPEKQFYHCFGCGAHGTAIGFLMEYDNLSFVEAVEELAVRERLEIPRESGGQSGPDYRPLYETLEQAADYYQQQLRRHPQAAKVVDYLRHRGLSGAIAADYGIGFAPPGWTNLLDRPNWGRKGTEHLKTCGMLSEHEDGRKYDRFRDRIMFPIRNRRGRVIGFGGRLLGDGKPKYLNSPETPLFHKGQELYGLYEALHSTRNPDRLLVVEGYMDVVALAQFEIRNTVATLGTATTRPHLDRLFRAAPEILFCFDGDRAGRAAAWKALETTLPVMRDGREACFLFLPDGEDPDTMVRKQGPQAFQRLMDEAVPLSTFLFDRLREQVDMQSLAGKARLSELAAPLLGTLPSGVLRQMMFKQLETIVGVEIPHPSRPIAASPAPKRRPRTGAFLGTMPPVRRAIALLVSNPGLAATESLPAGWETLPLPGIPILKELLENLHSEPNLTTVALLERWRHREEGKYLGQLTAFLLPLQQEGQLRELRDTLSSLARQALMNEWENLMQKAAAEGLSTEDKKRLLQLSEEKMKRDNQENDG